MKTAELQKAITLLKQALSDLNAVPNRKYCENYKTAEEIERFLKTNEK